MLFFINNDDWYIILLFSSSMFLGRLFYDIFVGIIKGTIKYFNGEK